MGWALAIDFGTSNTAAAHTGPLTGRIETLPLTHHSNLMSSAVYVEDRDTVLTGTPAYAAADRDPTRFVASPKRLIGKVPVMVFDGEQVGLDAVIAPVLATALERGIAAHNGVAPSTVVLTHPEAWSPQHISVLIDAAVCAGVPSSAVQTLSEPRAATHHYSRVSASEPGSRIAVFDFGGGTLDVAVLEAGADGHFSVIAARGDNGLGGRTFDLRIRQWMEESFAEHDVDLATALRDAPPHVQRSIEEQVRRAKEILSESPSATITVDTGSSRRTVSITRGEFDALIADDIDRAVDLVRATLADAGITGPTDLAALYLTGGSARIPLVHTTLGVLGPVATLDDPKTVVAQGALLAIEATPPPGLETVVMRRTEAPGKKTGTRRRVGVIAAGVAVVVAAGIGVVAAQGADDEQVNVVAETPVSYDGTDPRNVTDLFPGEMEFLASMCTATGFSIDNTLRVSCEIPDGSVLSVPAADDTGVRLSAWTSDSTTLTQAQLRIRRNTDPQFYRENTAGTAIANLSAFGPRSILSTVEIVNRDLGIQVSVGNVRDIESANRFLDASGLLK